MREQVWWESKCDERASVMREQVWWESKCDERASVMREQVWWEKMRKWGEWGTEKGNCSSCEEEKGMGISCMANNSLYVLGLGKNSVWILPLRWIHVCVYYIYIFSHHTHTQSSHHSPPRPGCALTKAVTFWRDKRGANRLEEGGEGKKLLYWAKEMEIPGEGEVLGEKIYW